MSLLEVVALQEDGEQLSEVGQALPVDWVGVLVVVHHLRVTLDAEGIKLLEEGCLHLHVQGRDTIDNLSPAAVFMVLA